MTAIFKKLENGMVVRLCNTCNYAIRDDIDFNDTDWKLYKGEIRNTALFMEFCSACKDEGKKSGNANLTLAK